MKIIIDAIKRSLALALTEVAAIMAGGSLLDIAPWKAGLIAGMSALFSVWAELGRSYYTDGKLTEDEVNAAFAEKQN
jgi:hypothetical protein